MAAVQGDSALFECNIIMTILNFDERPLDKQMFFGNQLGVQEYITVDYPEFMKLHDLMEDSRWREHDISLHQDADQAKQLSRAQEHIFTSNLQSQVVADSIQGRGPFALLPYVTDTSLELCIGSWGSFEQLHSKSYTYILRALYTDPQRILKLINKDNPLLPRFQFLIDAYNTFFSNPTKENLVIAVMAIYILESLQFYCSFACTFSFASMGIFEGVGKTMALIARDENMHTAIGNNIINNWRLGIDGPEWLALYRCLIPLFVEMWDKAVVAEKLFAKYLFQYGTPLLGLNENVLGKYIEYMSNKRMVNVGLPDKYSQTSDPLPFIQQRYLSSKNRQEAPQEVQLNTYRIGTIDKVSSNDLRDLFDV